MNKSISVIGLAGIFLLLAAAPWASAADVAATLDDAAGSSAFSVKDSGSVEGAHIDSDGNMVLKGGLRLDASGVENTTAENLIVDGNVGIGTTAPNNLLQVLDLVSFDNTDVNTKLGYQAGKNIVSGADSNTFLGYQAGLSHSSLSTSAADRNTAIGYTSLGSNTTGSRDTAVGAYSLFYNTTGAYNTANGALALYVNTTGESNVAGGYASLSNNTTGSNNVALGGNAGIYQADGVTALADPENSVYIGQGVRGYSNADSNSIVIGYNAIGIGANTVVLGNDSIVTTAMKGNVGIGTTGPGAKLDVNGGILVEGTNQLSFTTAGAEYIYSPYAGALHTVSRGGIRLWADSNSNDDNSLPVFEIHSDDAAEAGTAKLVMLGTGNVGIGTTVPTAVLHLKAGTATASTAPLKLTSGTVLTTSEAGAVEYDGTHLYFTAADAGTRYQLDQQGGSQTPWTSAINAAGYTLNGNSTASGNLTLDSTSDSTKGYVLLNPTSGNVGIGTTGPGYKLQVIGTTGFNGDSTWTSGSILTLPGAGYINLDGANYFGGGTYFRSTAGANTNAFINGDGGASTNTYFSAIAGNVGIGTTVPAAHLQIDGNLSAAAWTTDGIAFDSNAATYTDTSTAAAGTVAVRTANSFGAPTLASTNAITVTDAFTLYVPKPVAGTNTTITRANSAYFEGNVGIGTTSPGSKLFVNGTIGIPYGSLFQFTESGPSASGVAYIQEGYGLELWGSAGDYPVQVLGSSLSVGYNKTTAGDWGTGNLFVSGNVGIGTTAPSTIFAVVQTSATDPIADAWTIYSSRRWKDNIQPLDGALEKVLRLRGVTFNWKADGKHDIGMIAEEVGEVIPEVVAYEENGVDAKSLDYARLTAVLVEAVKAQQGQIETLKNQNADLAKAFQELKARLDTMETGGKK